MRTKTLLLSALACAAGVSAASAQVYSVNAVGYVNVEVPTGFSMIANPLSTADNTVGALLNPATSGLADGTTVYKFNPETSQYSVNVLDFGEWSNPTETLNPGEGAFIQNPAGAVTVTFVGEVVQGDISQAIPAGFSIQASQVPQSGQLDTSLEFPATDGDVVFMYDNASTAYSVHAFDFGEWSLVPSPSVGEAFFVNKVAATTWDRNFSVNN